MNSEAEKPIRITAESAEEIKIVAEFVSVL